MPTKVNNLEIFHTEVVFVPNNGSVWIYYANGTNSVKVNIQLISRPKNPTTRSQFTGREDHALIELTNWFENEETTFKQPIRLGETVDKQQLSILAYGRHVGGFLRLEVQFYLGDFDG